MDRIRKLSPNWRRELEVLSNFFNHPSKVVSKVHTLKSANSFKWDVQLLYEDTYVVEWRQREVIHDFPHMVEP